MEFKAVEWVRAVRDEHYELTKSMSPEERAKFYQERAAAVLKELEERKKRPPPDDNR